MKGRFLSIWLSYFGNRLFGHSSISPLRRAMNCVAAPFELRHVRHVTFEQLSTAGDDVRTFDDGAVPLEPGKVPEWPQPWKFEKRVVMPKVAVLRDVTLFDSGLALLPDGRYCYFDTKWGRAKMHGCGLPGERGEVFIHAHHATDSMLIRRHLYSTDMPGRYFSMLSSHPRNFGHFVHDVLSRIYYEDLGVIAPGRDRLIVAEMPWPMQRALFSKVFEGYDIVYVPIDSPLTPLRVEELLLPVNLCQPNRFNPLAIAALAKRVRRILANLAGKEKHKVCVSRSKDGNFDKETRRDFANAEAYETRMRKLGYRVVHISEIDPEEQFALWANATDIVGIHGAGMMNMIMMPPGGNYTEIARMNPNNHYGHNAIARCAIAVGHNVAGLACAPNALGRLEIDLDRLENLLLNTF